MRTTFVTVAATVVPTNAKTAVLQLNVRMLLTSALSAVNEERDKKSKIQWCYINTLELSLIVAFGSSELPKSSNAPSDNRTPDYSVRFAENCRFFWAGGKRVTRVGGEVRFGRGSGGERTANEHKGTRKSKKTRKKRDGSPTQNLSVDNALPRSRPFDLLAGFFNSGAAVVAGVQPAVAYSPQVTHVNSILSRIAGCYPG